MKLVLAEKPSVARDLARVLGAGARHESGALAGSGYVITWCIGHLVELEEPHAYEAAWKRWSWATLPMIPETFRLRPSKRTLAQWRVVRDLLRQRDFEVVINACDAGREGELIFRYAYQRANSKLPIQRLWISSLTPDAIRRGFTGLRDGAEYEALAAAARSRSESDWLVGLNATRAMTLASRRKKEDRGVYSIGRVQTPTLALIVEREQEIRRFIPKDFWEVGARATKGSDAFLARWTSAEGSTRLASEALAKALEARVAPRVPLLVADVAKKELTERAPQLFDLTSLQQLANRRFGFAAERTLRAAQTLYEKHKLITYPRTSSRHLTEEEEKELPRLIGSFDHHPVYGAFAQRLSLTPLVVGKRIVDASKVGDHPAIIPTGAPIPELRGDEAKVFDLIVRRFLAAFHPDARFLSTEILLVTEASAKKPASRPARDAILAALPPEPDRFVARGRVVLDPGWHAVEPPKASEEQLLPEVKVGERLPAALEISRGKTQPPRRHSDATLLGAMETAGKRVEDEQAKRAASNASGDGRGGFAGPGPKEVREAMKDRGLGTPATRASIIETLIDREYVRREKKVLVPTPKGIELIEELPVPTLRSAELTGEWEARLSSIARGAEPSSAFMDDVKALVREIVERIRSGRPPAQVDLQTLVCPECRRKGLVRGRQAWGCAHWRTGCTFTVPFLRAGRELTPQELVDLVAQREVVDSAGA